MRLRVLFACRSEVASVVSAGARGSCDSTGSATPGHPEDRVGERPDMPMCANRREPGALARVSALARFRATQGQSRPVRSRPSGEEPLWSNAPVVDSEGSSLGIRERRAAVAGGVVAVSGATGAYVSDGVGAAVLTAVVAFVSVALVLAGVWRLGQERNGR